MHVHLHEKGEFLTACGFFARMPGFSPMDHEKLDVYRVSLEVVRSVGQILKPSTTDRVIRGQILRSSTSILLNIAEGTGKRSSADLPFGSSRI